MHILLHERGKVFSKIAIVHVAREGEWGHEDLSSNGFGRRIKSLWNENLFPTHIQSNVKECELFVEIIYIYIYKILSMIRV